MRGRYAASLVDQAAGALLAFGINLWLIRTGAGDAYGVFVFWYSVALVSNSFVGALTMAHLFPLPTGPGRMAQRHGPEQVLLSITLILTAVTTLGTLGAALLLTGGEMGLGQPTAAVFVGGFVLSQYSRGLAFSRGLVMPVTIQTCVTLGIVIAGLGADWVVGAHEDAGRVLMLVGFAYTVTGAIMLLRLSPGIRPTFDRVTIERFVPYLRKSHWLILGALSGELTGRLYSFVVVGSFGAGALGRLSAAQVALRPAWMLVTAWSPIGRTTIANQIAAGDRTGVAGTVMRGVFVTLAGSLLWGAIVVVCWPVISGTLFHGRYGDAMDLAILWTGNVALGSITLSLNTGLQALGAFRPLAVADLAGAALTTVLTFFVVPLLGYPFSITAIMAGQVTQAVLMTAYLVRALRAPVALAVAAE